VAASASAVPSVRRIVARALRGTDAEARDSLSRAKAFTADVERVMRELAG